MFFKFIFIMLSLFSTIGYSDIEYDQSFDFTVGLSPTVTPETGYDNLNVRMSVGVGVSLFRS